MTNFLSKYDNSEVENMRLQGGLVSTYDENGNLLISSNETNLSSSVITVSLYSPRFSTDSILKLSDRSFTELAVDSPTSATQSLETVSDVKVLYENQVDINTQLQSKIDELTIKLNDPEKISDELTIKDTIIQLRIQNGEGSTEEDFHNEFPYTAIEKLT